MLAVTTRSSVQERLKVVATLRGLGTPTFFAQASELPWNVTDQRVLFLDLSSCCREAHLETTVRGWATRHPGCQVILFVPLVDRECETRAMFSIACLGIGQVMTASDFVRADVWATITRQGRLSALQKELWDEFRCAVERTGRTLPAESVVKLFLANAPTSVNVNAISLAVAADLQLQSGVARKALWSQLKAAGQLSPSWLLLIFRVLWYRKLVALGWRERDIVAFLGLRATRQLRLMLKRRLGTSIRSVRELGYGTLIDWAAACTVDSAGFETRTPERLLASVFGNEVDAIARR